MSATDLASFVTGLLVLTAATVGVARAAGVRLGASPLVALVRAGLQLTLVALLLRGILAVEWAVLGFVALMLTTASGVAGARLQDLHHGRRAAVAGVVTGAVVSLTLIVLLGLVATEARYLVAVAGIVVGNAMSAATLSGRNFLRASGQRRDEIEAWFALGATCREAHRDIGQESVREALLPTLDQTRSTGLVTLPGAFVGALFGGASPAQAAQFQLVVLAGIALCMTVTGVVTTEILNRTPFLLGSTDHS